MTAVETKPTFLDDVGLVLRAGRADVVESRHKPRLFALTTVAIGTIAVNGPKIPLVVAPKLALETLQYTGNPLITGIVTGAIYGTWTLAAAGIIDATGRHFPKAKQTVRDRLSRATDFLAYTLPGFNIESDGDTLHRNRAARLGHRALTHARRGLTVLGIGAGFYVGTAQVKEKSNEEIRRLRRLASGDAALMIGSLSCATTAAVAKITESNPALAEQLQDSATDTKTLVGLALSLIIGQHLNQRRKKSHLQKTA